MVRLRRQARLCCSPAIGEHKGATGKVGVERLLMIESGQHAAFPDELIGVAFGALLPGLRAASPSNALADQQQVGPSDGLVIELRFSLRGRKALQCRRKSLQ